jgi:uncharacterized RDD family membrane protein YckC
MAPRFRGTLQAGGNPKWMPAWIEPWLVEWIKPASGGYIACPVNDATHLQAWIPGEPWRRLLATLADLLFFLPIAMMAVPAMELAIKWQNSAPLALVNVGWWVVGLYLIVRFQGTPGKRLLGLRIVRTDGRRAGWLDAINRQILFIGLSGLSLMEQGRVLASAPSGTTLEGFLDLLTENPGNLAWLGDAGLAFLWASCLLILMRPDRRSLYDLWSGTVVVRAVRKPVVPAT